MLNFDKERYVGIQPGAVGQAAGIRAALLIARAIMGFRGEDENNAEIVAELELFPELLLEVKATFEPRAEAVALEIKYEQNHVITGATTKRATSKQ